MSVCAFIWVDPPGLEPGLCGTKIRRVANYTMGQNVKTSCKIRNFFEKCSSILNFDILINPDLMTVVYRFIFFPAHRIYLNNQKRTFDKRPENKSQFTHIVVTLLKIPCNFSFFYNSLHFR